MLLVLLNSQKIFISFHKRIKKYNLQFIKEELSLVHITCQLTDLK